MLLVKVGAEVKRVRPAALPIWPVELNRIVAAEFVRASEANVTSRLLTLMPPIVVVI